MFSLRPSAAEPSERLLWSQPSLASLPQTDHWKNILNSLENKNVNKLTISFIHYLGCVFIKMLLHLVASNITL